MNHSRSAGFGARIGLWAGSVALLHGALCAQKLQVYILAGQSNMEGHAKVSTFDYLGDDPATAPLLARMRDADGKPRVCDDVWISYFTGGRSGDGEGFGPLTAGFGARTDPTKDGGKIGPEFTFGLRMGKAHEQPVLLIKTAWGGKSLHTDFRPPSAGPFVFDQQQLEQFAKQGKDVAQLQADKAAATGHCYRLMIEHCKRVLGDLGRVCPAYDERKGYELAGFVWFQGWNDMVDRGVYPQRDKPDGYAQYSDCLTHFIRDVRKDLGAPQLPFVIGVMGVGGPIGADADKRAVHVNFRAAMAAPAALPEFVGNVVAVETAPYWDTRLADIADRMDKVRGMAAKLKKEGTKSAEEQKALVDKYRAEIVGEADELAFSRGASNGGYHYLGCAKTMALIGVAFADAMLSMEK